MTASERDEWNGNTGKNLFDKNLFVYKGNRLLLSTANDVIKITALENIPLYVTYVIECDPFDYGLYVDENNILTIGVDAIKMPSGAVCNIRLLRYKYDWTDIVSVNYTPEIQANSYVTYTIDTSKGGHKLEIAVGGLSAGQSVIIRGFRINRGTRIYPYVRFGVQGANDVVRGAYNFTDFNRVEQSVAYLSDAFGLSLVTKTDWTANDIPNINDFENRYLYNINKVCEKAGINGVKTTYSGFDYRAANEIEKALKSAEETLW